MKRRLFIFLSLIAILNSSLPAFAHAKARSKPPKTRIVTVDHGAQDPAVSPDGAQIAASVFGKIWVMFIAGGEARQISEGLAWDTHPAWSPDGQALAYAHQLPGGTELIVRNLTTGSANTIYQTESGIGQIAFHPKGSELFFVLERSQYDAHLYRIPVGGGTARQLTRNENWHEWSFAISPDAKEVIYDSGRYGGSDLYRLQLDTLQSSRVTQTPVH